MSAFLAFFGLKMLSLCLQCLDHSVLLIPELRNVTTTNFAGLKFRGDFIDHLRVSAPSRAVQVDHMTTTAYNLLIHSSQLSIRFSVNRCAAIGAESGDNLLWLQHHLMLHASRNATCPDETAKVSTFVAHLEGSCWESLACDLMRYSGWRVDLRPLGTIHRIHCFLRGWIWSVSPNFVEDQWKLCSKVTEFRHHLLQLLDLSHISPDIHASLKVFPNLFHHTTITSTPRLNGHTCFLTWRLGKLSRFQQSETATSTFRINLGM